MTAMKDGRAVILLVCVCLLSVMAPTVAAPETRWTYHADNGGPAMAVPQELKIIITRTPRGYEVSGELTRATIMQPERCSISGQYFPNPGRPGPAGRLLARAFCPNPPEEEVAIDGFKQPDGSLQITKPFSATARTVGARPPQPKVAAPSPPARPDLSGTWTCTNRCPAGAKSKNMNASIAQAENKLTFINEGGDMSPGSFTGASTVVATGWGNLTATIESGGKELHWANGTVWKKQ
jgi:hypothetical protein